MKSRVFWSDLGAWNNAYYVYLGAPLLAVLGATVGSLWAVHLVPGESYRAFVVGGCIGVTMLAGLTLLALVDRHGTE